MPAKAEIAQLSDNLNKSDMPATLAALSRLESQGIKPTAIAAGLSDLIRQSAAETSIEPWQVALLRQLLDVSASHRPQEALEISLLSSVAERVETKSSQTGAVNSSAQIIRDVPPVSKLAIKSDKIAEPAARKVNRANPSFDLSQWDEVIERCKKQAASVYTALRLANPDYSDGVLTLSFQFPLHQKKLELAKNKDLVAQIIEEICGQRISLKTVLDKRPAQKTLDNGPVSPVSSISNIFGSAEVLEA
jgi:hypothetical protein